MNAIVFGANGQLGKCLTDIQWGNRFLRYRFFDRSQFDITDPDAYSTLQDSDVDVLINCAAYTNVDQAETERDQAHRINVSGPALMARYGLEHNVTIIHISTDYVYGPATEPIRESQSIAPVNFYGLTKWEGEEAVRQSGVRHVILRTSWLYSEYGHNFVKTMLRLAGNHAEISVVNDQTGSPTYANDLAKAVDHLVVSLQGGESIVSGTYNFANKGSVTWYEFAREILKHTAVKVIPIPSDSYPTPATRPVYSVLDTSSFEKTFQRTIPDWKDGLDRCMVRLQP